MTHDNKLQVEAIKRGTVIDHIPAQIGFKLLSLFKLTETDQRITIVPGTLPRTTRRTNCCGGWARLERKPARSPKSPAELANAMREEIRDLMRAGKTDAEVLGLLTTRYGDFVLFRPPFKPVTYLLWLGPSLFLGLGALFWFVALRARRRPVGEGQRNHPGAERQGGHQDGPQTHRAGLDQGLTYAQAFVFLAVAYLVGKFHE